jgi:hypothetical protein
MSCCVLDGHFRPSMPLFCTGVHPRWFCSSLYTHPGLFFVLFGISPSPRELRVFYVLFWRPAGTSGVFMYCFGALRELPGKET